MTKNKEKAREEYIEMIRESWTYKRLTEEERARVCSALDSATIIGTWRQRWEQLQNIYSAFLDGCGYTPQGWRETKDERIKHLVSALMRTDSVVDRDRRPYGARYIEVVRELSAHAAPRLDGVENEIVSKALDALTEENYHTMREAAEVAYNLRNLETIENNERAFCERCQIDYETGKFIA